MSRVVTWLWGQKRLQSYFRALTRHLPVQCRDLRLLPASKVNYSSYLSSYLQNKDFKNPGCSFPKGDSLPPKVPRHQRGTFSLDGNAPMVDSNTSWRVPAEIEKNVFIAEINKIPSRYRAGLARLAETHRSKVFLCLIFSPSELNYELAKKSDFYCLKKRNWQPVIRELGAAFARFSAQGDVFPTLKPRFTLREKLIIRILFRFKQRFVKVEEISSYLYGKRLSKNIHASEVILAGLRQKLENLTGRATAIRNIRNYGYQIQNDVWEKIIKSNK